MMIVDDEPLVVDGLSSLFEEKNLYELDICKAYSGHEALEWLKRARFDIVVIDICMPDKNGLDLIEDILKYNIHCRIIFLTGLDSFNSIYKACQYDNVQYVLKMDGDEKIFEAVKKAVGQIENDLKDKDIVLKAQEQLSRYIPVIQKEYITGLLHGDYDPPGEMARRFKELKIPLNPFKKAYVLVARVMCGNGTVKLSEIMQMLCEIVNIADEYLSKNIASIAVTMEYSAIIWLVQDRDVHTNELTESYSSKKYSELLQIIKSTVDSVKMFCENHYRISLTFLLNIKPVEWENISKVFLKIRYLMKYRTGFEGEVLFMDTDSVNDVFDLLNDSDIMLKTYNTYMNRLDLLKVYLENGNEHEFFKMLHEIRDFVTESMYGNGTFIKEIYHSISLVILSYINQVGMSDMPEIKNCITYNRFTEWREVSDSMFNDFEKTGSMIFDNLKKCKTERHLYIIKKINDYINDNLDRDVSLTKLSEITHFHPGHLSRIYKQIAGINVMDYINECKINKAMELLSNGELKIYEIAKKMGFSTPQYFNRFFKKHKMVTPQEFKSMIQSNGYNSEKNDIPPSLVKYMQKG